MILQSIIFGGKTEKYDLNKNSNKNWKKKSKQRENSIGFRLHQIDVYAKITQKNLFQISYRAKVVKKVKLRVRGRTGKGEDLEDGWK